ncbi:MAG TPA: hypothetical protein PLQ15_00820 [Syntrophales bacterium]|nr:hypothetical protein [Syntrophales bacterium]
MKKKREENILIVDDVSTFFASVDIKDPKPLNQTFTISAEDMVPSAIISQKKVKKNQIRSLET